MRDGSEKIATTIESIDAKLIIWKLQMLLALNYKTILSLKQFVLPCLSIADKFDSDHERLDILYLRIII